MPKKKKVHLYKTSFGWYADGYEIRKSTIPGRYNMRQLRNDEHDWVVGMKRVREVVERGNFSPP